MRVTGIVQRRIAFALFCLTTAAVHASGNTPETGADCESAMPRLLDGAVLEVAGLTRVSRSVSIPADAIVVISIAEEGIDVRAEVTVAPGDLRMADNPIRRWGPQRVVLDRLDARKVEVAVIGKERSTGRIRLAVHAFTPTATDSTCIGGVRLLARGDSLYDRGQAVTLSRADAGKRSAVEEYQAAERSYREAASRLASRQASRLRGQAHLSRATIYDLWLDQYQEALAPAKDALDAFSAATDAYGRDRARAVAASANTDLALIESRTRVVTPYPEALTKTRLASTRGEWLDIAKSHETRGEFYDQAMALNFAGLTYNIERDFAPAIRYFERAFAIQERLGERTRMGQVIQNLALAQSELGRYSLARQTYQRAFTWLDAAENPKLYADTMNNLALSEVGSGRVDDALRHYSTALETLTRIQNPREQARSLQGIGVTYYAIGKRTEATSYYQRALEIRERDPRLDPAGLVATLRAIADSERDSGRPTEAIARREQALLLTNNARMRARIGTDLAQDFIASGQLARANDELAQVFAADLSQDAVTLARALTVRAQSWFAKKSFDRAALDAFASFNAYQKLELSGPALAALTLQAQAACAAKDYATASRLARGALTRSEALRSASDNPLFRASIWRALRPAYDLAIQLAAAPRDCGGAGRADAFQALAISERARGRALDDFRRIADLARAGKLGANDEKRLELLDQIAEKRASLERLADRHEDTDKAMRALREEIAGLLRELDIVGAQSFEDAASSETSDEALRLANERLRPDTAVVEYWLGEKKSYAWLITRGRVQMVDLGDTARIESAVREFQTAMRDFTRVRSSERVRLARLVFALVVAPLPTEIHSAHRVFFIPDGVLHGVPFAALVTNEAGVPEYLVATRDVAVSSSLRAVADDGQPLQLVAGAPVLIVADPVYSRDDGRFSTGAPSRHAAVPGNRNIPVLRGGADRTRLGGEWSRLVAAGREAASIEASLPRAKVEKITGFAANRDAVLQRDLRRYRVMHFATHAIADMEAPQLSMLVLSLFDDRGDPRVGEVLAGDLLYRPLDADLVVFSGCETALGQSHAGEGLFGLRYAAHAAGGRTVIASLWPVTDLVGEALMRELYTALANEKLAPEAALSRSMRLASKRWADPALWSVFEVSRVAAARTLH